MAETAWTTADRPRHLIRLTRRRPSGRKYLLLACALVRRRARHLNPLGVRILDAVERFAVAQPRKGVRTHIWREVIRPAAPELPDILLPHETRDCGPWLVQFASRFGTLSTVNPGDVNAVIAVLLPGPIPYGHMTATTAATATVCEVIREVFADPLRPPTIEPEWLLCNHGAVRHIAEAIAANGSFADLPILGDALEDAGCRDPALLAHCRSGSEHAPGCWALDLVLGKG